MISKNPLGPTPCAEGASLPLSFKDARALRIPWTAPKALITGKTKMSSRQYNPRYSSGRRIRTGDLYTHGFRVSHRKVWSTTSVDYI